MLRPEAGSRRRQGFKKGVDAEEGSRRRDNNIVTLRKNKRDENLQKKRLVNLDQPAAAGEMGDYAYSPTTGLSQKVVREHKYVQLVGRTCHAVFVVREGARG